MAHNTHKHSCSFSLTHTRTRKREGEKDWKTSALTFTRRCGGKRKKQVLLLLLLLLLGFYILLETERRMRSCWARCATWVLAETEGERGDAGILEMALWAMCNTRERIRQDRYREGSEKQRREEAERETERTERHCENETKGQPNRETSRQKLLHEPHQFALSTTSCPKTASTSCRSANYRTKPFPQQVGGGPLSHFAHLYRKLKQIHMVTGTENELCH